MNFVIIILFIVFCIALTVIQSQNHKKRIYEQVEAIGGMVVCIERRIFSTGPFILVGRGSTVYRIEYEINGQINEGWVRFGGLIGPDWRL